MAKIPYLLHLDVVLTGNGTGTMTYTVPNGEQLDLYEIRQKATGAFNITDIRIGSGMHFTNASALHGIANDTFQSGSSPNLGFEHFNDTMIIPGGETFYIDVQDTSGSGNTVKIDIMGMRTLPG